MLAENGVKEITLLGQNVNSYGTRNDSEISFASLLREVSGINGIERIRFTTSHPKDLSAEVISCFNDLPKLCGHIHLPAQSGSDKILNRMERGYTRAEYLARIKALVAVRPDIQVTGDMIVGFPGETEEDFAETISLMQEVRYADLFSFIYSARPETRAASYPDQLTYREKQERLSILQKHQKEMTLERNLSFVGSIQKILVEGKSKQESQMFGRTEGNRIVNFESEDNSLVGRITDVLITKAHQNSLLGRVVTSADIEA
jgi:tRNA-2-methylthio-N6-dimethylallyladenosine synthase